MRVIMFQDRFAELVRTGAKTTTIRAAARCKPGDMLSLRRWSGQPYRSKQTVLREAVVESISRVYIGEFCGLVKMLVDGVDQGTAAAVARADGFESPAEMATWFEQTHGLPFEGDLIRWGDTTGEAALPAGKEA